MPRTDPKLPGTASRARTGPVARALSAHASTLRARGEWDTHRETVYQSARQLAGVIDRNATARDGSDHTLALASARLLDHLRELTPAQPAGAGTDAHLETAWRELLAANLSHVVASDTPAT